MLMKTEFRKWKLDDALELLNIINNPSILDHLRDDIPYLYTLKDVRDFILGFLKAQDHSQYYFAIVGDERIIGSIGVFLQNNIHVHSGELGYYLAQSYWKKVMMTEAVKQICRYIFDNTDIIRIYASPFTYNEASCRVLEKAGFSFEGILSSHELIKI